MKNPQTLNEKIQWLKLFEYQNNELITQLVDKFRVREYITREGYGSLLNELYAVYDNVQEIQLGDLPDQFVLKCNHDSGSIIICEDKEKFDFKKAKKNLDKCLKQDFWLKNVEVQYKNVKKRLSVKNILSVKKVI